MNLVQDAGLCVICAHLGAAGCLALSTSSRLLFQGLGPETAVWRGLCLSRWPAIEGLTGVRFCRDLYAALGGFDAGSVNVLKGGRQSCCASRTTRPPPADEAEDDGAPPPLTADNLVVLLEVSIAPWRGPAPCELPIKGTGRPTDGGFSGWGGKEIADYDAALNRRSDQRGPEGVDDDDDVASDPDGDARKSALNLEAAKRRAGSWRRRTLVASVLVSGHDALDSALVALGPRDDAKAARIADCRKKLADMGWRVSADGTTVGQPVEVDSDDEGVVFDKFWELTASNETLDAVKEFYLVDNAKCAGVGHHITLDDRRAICDELFGTRHESSYCARLGTHRAVLTAVAIRTDTLSSCKFFEQDLAMEDLEKFKEVDHEDPPEKKVPLFSARHREGPYDGYPAYLYDESVDTIRSHIALESAPPFSGCEEAPSREQEEEEEEEERSCEVFDVACYARVHDVVDEISEEDVERHCALLNDDPGTREDKDERRRRAEELYVEDHVKQCMVFRSVQLKFWVEKPESLEPRMATPAEALAMLSRASGWQALPRSTAHQEEERHDSYIEGDPRTFNC